jgi:hypothetical protein
MSVKSSETLANLEIKSSTPSMVSWTYYSETHPTWDQDQAAQVQIQEQGRGLSEVLKMTSCRELTS